MTEDFASLRIRIETIEAHIGRKRLEDLAKQSQKTERATDGLTRSFRVARQAIIAYGGAVGAREIIRAADSFQQMNAQIKLVSKSNEEAAQSYDDLLKLAQLTRTDMSATVELFTRLKRSTDGLNLSNEQLYTVTRAVNQGLKVSGASAQETESVVRQLSQGLASGALRGDEFNSVSEQGARITKALADELGVQTGALRKLAGEGKITSKIIAAALINQSKKIEEEYRVLPITVSDAMTQLTNDLNDAFGRTDTKPLVESIDRIRVIITDPDFQQSLADISTSLTKVLGFGVEFFAEFLNAGRNLGVYAAQAMGAKNATEDLRKEIARLEKLRGASDYTRRNVGPYTRIDGEVDYFLDENEVENEIKLKKEQLNALLKAQGFAVEGATAETQTATSKTELKAKIERGQNDVKFIESRIKALQLEAKTVGATAREREKALLLSKGATEKEIAKINAQFDVIEAAERKKSFKSLVESLDSEEEAIKRSYEKRRALILANTHEGEQRQTLLKKLDDSIIEPEQKDTSEFDYLVSSLKREEEIIVESYRHRKELILANTKNNEEARKDLLTRLNDEFAGNVLSGFESQPVSFDDRINAVKEEYERRREIILANTELTLEQQTELETRLTKEKNERIKQLENERTRATLLSSSQMFDGLAGIAKVFAGEQSGIYRGMFAASKAFAVAEAIIKIQQGIASAASIGWPQNIPAIASTVEQTSSVLSTIQNANLNVSGAYDHGGMIPAGKTGIVGEYGPELIRGPVNVTSRRTTADMQPNNPTPSSTTTPDVNVRIINVQDPAAIKEFMTSREGEKIIVNQMKKNERLLKGN